MPQYQSHKKVWALKIATVTDCGKDTTTDENPIVEVTFEDKVFAPRKFNLRGKPTPQAGWYFVQYADGYTSFSPAEAFETGHTEVRVADAARKALLEKLSDAADSNEVGEDFGGSATEAAEREGKAEAFSTAYGWVDSYFKQAK